MRVSIIGVLLFSAISARADTITNYTVLFQGKPGGAQMTRVAGDGKFTVDFRYRNNGRGPDLKEDFVLDNDGTLKRYSVKGSSTYGAPIDESFQRTADKAEWRSSSDHGTSTVKESAAYVPVEASPEVFARIVRAAAVQPGRRLKALPGGELQVEKLLDEPVQVGDKSRDVSLYALKGLHDEPSYYWVTREPEMTLFASIYPGWQQIIEVGWENVADQLERRQVEVGNALLEKLATGLSHRLPDPIVIRNARIFDSENAVLAPARDVYVNAGKIAAIYDTGSPAKRSPPKSMHAAGCSCPASSTCTPTFPTGARLHHIAGGVTTVRDLGNDNAFLAKLIDRIDKRRDDRPAHRAGRIYRGGERILGQERDRRIRYRRGQEGDRLVMRSAAIRKSRSITRFARNGCPRP